MYEMREKKGWWRSVRLWHRYRGGQERENDSSKLMLSCLLRVARKTRFVGVNIPHNNLKEFFHFYDHFFFVIVLYIQHLFVLYIEIYYGVKFFAPLDVWGNWLSTHQPSLVRFHSSISWMNFKLNYMIHYRGVHARFILIWSKLISNL